MRDTLSPACISQHHNRNFSLIIIRKKKNKVTTDSLIKSTRLLYYGHIVQKKTRLGDADMMLHLYSRPARAVLHQELATGRD